jgi:hypothetical protein
MTCYRRKNGSVNLARLQVSQVRLSFKTFPRYCTSRALDLARSISRTLERRTWSKSKCLVAIWYQDFVGISLDSIIVEGSCYSCRWKWSIFTHNLNMAVPWYTWTCGSSSTTGTVPELQGRRFDSCQRPIVAFFTAQCSWLGLINVWYKFPLDNFHLRDPSTHQQ